MPNTDNKQNSETWTIDKEERDLANPILIEGLPGVGNVGKVIVDYLIEELDADHYASFFSYTMPNSVFVTEDNKVNLPTIDLYNKDVNGRTYLFLTGDVQPTNEKGSYTLSETILNIIQKDGCQEVITLGGIGLSDPPEDPTVYCTGTDDDYLEQFEKAGANRELYGKVGPIIGITGLLIGLSKNRPIESAALLTETKSHPVKLGLTASKASMAILEKTTNLAIDLANMENKIEQMREDMEKESKDSKQTTNNVINETGYIG